ncbi:MAG: lysoplasmalogenase [Chitinophagaceae bacterium]|nr:lysoplasmalogenase [Chitinophagaceae bacterium]
MNRKLWMIIFMAVVIAHLTAIAAGHLLLQQVTKPLIILTLGVYFFSCVGRSRSSLIKWVALALFFSWVGDILLMFQGRDSIFFILGLSSFLLAHVFYIIFFHQLRVGENIKSNPWLLVIVAVYYATLMYFLSPHLLDMKVPVRIYGIVISFMFLLAMHMPFMAAKNIGRLLMTGALLFVISDSILAIDKFYRPFEMASILIMLTYAAAQFIIVEGAARYINMKSNFEEVASG